MSVPSDLAGALDAKAGAAAADGSSGGSDSGSAGSSTEGGAGGEQPGTEGSASFIGIDDSDSGDGGSAGEGGQSDVAAPSWELALAPDAVVATVDGKPLTAAELKDGFLRQRDYTLKTQEASRLREQATEAIEFIEDNAKYIRRIASGDPEQVAVAFIEAAADNGVELVLAGSSRTQGRDSGGRFTKAPTAVDLDKIKEDEGEDSWAYRMAVQNQELAQQLSTMGEKFDKFSSGVERQAASQQAASELSAVASEWRGKGFEADVRAAMRLVGQPMSAEHAMYVANLAGLIAHNVKIARGGRSPAGSARGSGGSGGGEPGGQGRSSQSLAGKSLEEAVRLRTGQA